MGKFGDMVDNPAVVQRLIAVDAAVRVDVLVEVVTESTTCLASACGLLFRMFRRLQEKTTHQLEALALFDSKKAVHG